MQATASTKITKGGQTTVPREIREALGVGPEDRVYWNFEGDRAYITAAPEVPLSVTSAKDFWDRIDHAKSDIAQGRLVDAVSLSEKLRSL